MKLQVWVVAALLMASFGAKAQEGCLDESLIKDIQNNIELRLDDVDSFDRCKEGSHTYKVLQALSMMRTIKFDQNALGRPFNQDILPTDFWGYFQPRAQAIEDEEKCPKGVLAFVYGLARDGVVHVCPSIYEESMSVYELAETMLHEVRHFEGYGHTTCSRGPRNGMPGACDSSIEQKGSYAVTVETLTKMAMAAKTISHMEKTMLKILALTYANEAFNTPIQARDLSAFFLVDNRQRSYIYSDKGLVEVSSLGDAKVISRRSGLAVFPADKSDAYMADVFTTELDRSPAMGTFSRTYNNTPIAQRPNVVDILNLDYMSASVTDTQVKGTLKNDTEDTPVTTPWKISAAYSSEEYGVADQDSLYLRNKAGEMFRLQFGANHQYSLQPVEDRLAGLASVSMFNGSRLALNAMGQVLSEEGGSWAPLSPLKKQTFVKMTRPFLWDQYFEDGASQQAPL